jgi:hypothetical protein
MVVALDGRASFDADGDPLTYSWTLISMPTGSRAALADSATATPFFTADLVGTYVAALVVNDGQVNSASPDISSVVGRQPRG